MVGSIAREARWGVSRGVAVIGGGVSAAQAALTLAEMGVEVKVVTSSATLGWGDGCGGASLVSPEERLVVWPLLLRAATHPLVTLYTNAEVTAVAGKRGRLTVRATRRPRYVRENACVGCGRCEAACSVQVPVVVDGQRVLRSAIRAPVVHCKTAPSAYFIEKDGVAPCRASCPLGINVQGFVSLLSKGKVDEALTLIHEAAPLAGVLGRVCTHPCEDSCKRVEVDDPVYIQGLHRYAADNASSDVVYGRKVPVGTKREKVAIVGSGPAGLAAGWELARRGYRPTIFEQHAVVGGMLATGIPRFRLPWEVRYKEVEMIRALGVDIKTGVTVGRDVTISDLRERKYRAFFLGIGAHENYRLGIGGEHLEGVVDAMSLLFALNLRVGASVGSSVVVIGGGNSAVDAARIANRRSKGRVRVLCIWKEMTAVKEDVEDAIKEGVQIDYETAPVEILGDGGKVTGVRCQRTVGGDMSPENFRLPRPIPGTDFVIDADQVVVAIGQRPNTTVLNMKWLDVDGDSAIIRVDPLTLETNTPGVFAGGDCITGSNNVVSAVAAGLRAADSIDRYLRGRDMRKGRSLEKPAAVDIDVRNRDVLYYKRARMPGIPISKRRGNYEETALGLPADAAEREAKRCLNCATCSECMECERVCELGAVFHGDWMQQVDVPAEIVIDCAETGERGWAGGAGGEVQQGDLPQTAASGIYRLQIADDLDVGGRLARASAIAFEVAGELTVKEGPQLPGADFSVAPAASSRRSSSDGPTAKVGGTRVGVVLCQCGGSVSSVVDFERVTAEVERLPTVCVVETLSQACSEDGAHAVGALMDEWNLERVVLAACRCCGLEQMCYSCADRRVLCYQNLSRVLGEEGAGAVEFANIREQCAWVHQDDVEGATVAATGIVTAGVARAGRACTPVTAERPVVANVVVLGAGLCGLAAARSLVMRGCSVEVVDGPRSARDEMGDSNGYLAKRDDLLRELGERGVLVRPWPGRLELGGSCGSHEVVLENGRDSVCLTAGAVMVDLGNRVGQIDPEDGSAAPGGLLGRVLASKNAQGLDDGDGCAVVRSVAMKETAGIFIMTGDAEGLVEEQLVNGVAAAARALAYVGRGVVSPRTSAVTIDSKLCRGCGDCAAICPYIEMKERGNGLFYACVDPGLCLGCGACVGRCPTGAIHQSVESNEQIVATLKGLMLESPEPVVAT